MSWFRRVSGARPLWNHYRNLFGIRAALLVLDRVLRHVLAAAQYRRWCRLTWMREPSALDLRPVPFLGNLNRKATDLSGYVFRSQESRLEAASMITEHKFDVLGSGIVDWGNPIQWHSDVVSGHRWKDRFYTAYKDEIAPGDGIDPKIPWELSRCHHLVSLAQAWWLTGDETWARECINQWESWLSENPWGFGINWTSPMEAAIRVTNWLWAFALLDEAPVWTESRRANVASALYQHGRFIEHNLEVGCGDGQVVAANHYLANLCGLACLGLCCEGREPTRWRDIGLRGLEKEVRRQVLGDGFFFEGSTSYHRLALEFFLFPAVLSKRFGWTLSSLYWAKLEQMLDVVCQLTGPDGSVPQIGDNDDGRLIILSGYPDWLRHDHRYLLSIGAALFDRSDFKTVGGYAEEVWWLLGEEGVRALQRLEDRCGRGSRGFPEGGLHVMRGSSDGDFALVRTGISRCRPTAHIHADALSLELWVNGQRVFIDPGTYCYTSEPDARILLRSAAMHNTVVLHGDGEADTDDLFDLRANGKVEVARWTTDETGPLLRAERTDLAVGGGSTVHRREIQHRAAQREWVVHDEVRGDGRHRATWHWHLSEWPLTLVHREAGEILFRVGPLHVTMRVSGQTHYETSVSEGILAPSYGTRTQCAHLQISTSWEGQVELFTTVGKAAA